MANLAPIIYSNATVRVSHAQSLNAAFVELNSAAGFAPRVLNTVESQAAYGSDSVSGGSRTLAESIRAGSGAASDHYEANESGHAAVDIDNQRAFRNKLGDKQFEYILAKYGWLNQQISGAPFPSEPWHFANHNASSSPAGGAATEGDKMDIVRIDAYPTGGWGFEPGYVKYLSESQLNTQQSVSGKIAPTLNASQFQEIIWNNALDEFELNEVLALKDGKIKTYRLIAAWRKAGTSSGSSDAEAIAALSTQVAALAKAVDAGFVKVNANVDDQPTTFKVTPA